jgi:excisionase family DNA binding protein
LTRQKHCRIIAVVYGAICREKEDGMVLCKLEEVERVAFTRREAIQSSGVPGHTLDQAIDAGELPATRSGRRLIILREDLLHWLRRCRDRGEIPLRSPSEAGRNRLADLNRARKAQK